MSATVPVIGSDAGGIPHSIREGENGFVFHSGDSAELGRRLRELLADGELRRRMGGKSYELAHTQLSERVYTSEFTRMVEATVRDGQ
jgi:glycosyltransferase involved in cell wall biosynthesis